MDVSSPPLAPTTTPKAVPDLRPAADAAATQRITEPPSAMAQGTVLSTPPVSVSQSALLSRNLIEGAPDEPVRVSSDGVRLTVVDPAQRVLKPFGIMMLPSTERETPGPAGRSATEDPRAGGPERKIAPDGADGT